MNLLSLKLTRDGATLTIQLAGVVRHFRLSRSAVDVLRMALLGGGRANVPLDEEVQGG